MDEHRFGGSWTTQKLDALSAYLQAYLTALKHQPFKKAYIDAFAGTGSRASRKGEGQLSMFHEGPELAAGSARRALRLNPSFDSYIFIERNRRRAQRLESLRVEFPSLADRIDIRQEDANKSIRSLCAQNWSRHRAVLFLDPYGMQVDWSTVEAVAATQAIDLWYLFPLWIGVNRLLPTSGAVPQGWGRRLDRVLGTQEWRERFYEKERHTDLFGDVEHLAEVSVTTIQSFVVERLQRTFAGVAEPGLLKNQTGTPMYLLIFACANPRAVRPALSIANHTLKWLR